MNITKLAAALALGTLSVTAFAQYAPYPDVGQEGESSAATGPYEKTQVQAQIRLDVDRNVEQVHFLRDNNDPNVVTKAYVLKHADPYEIRPFVKNAVSSRRIETSPTTVECIKYSDGTGILLVSAEDYRFTDPGAGMSIDQIVEYLDKPKLTSSSGQVTYLYFPKYFSAKALSQLIARVGANVEGDNVELQYGRDSLSYDSGLNAMLIYMPRYSEKHIAKLIGIYDIPAYDVNVKYKLYEIDAENDSKIGLDFQAWKNNGGADFFSVGGRFRDGWAASLSGGPNRTGTSKTQFLNFNPKWNTRYLDFLVSRGKAKVATQGVIRIDTTATGTVSATTGLFNFENGEQLTETTGFEFAVVADASTLVVTTKKGTTVNMAPYAGVPAMVTKIMNSEAEKYTVKLKGANFPNGKSAIKVANVLVKEEVKEPDGTITTIDVEPTWVTDARLAVQKGFKVETIASSYGFKLAITPTVAEKTTIMDLEITNESLIGWKSSGEPRISKDTAIKTRVMMNNDGKEFVIGGIEKRSLVTSVGGIPWLKDIPLLGYLFSTESQSTKKSRLVLVMDCTVVDTLGAKVEGAPAEVIKKAEGKLADAGVNIPYANTQYGFRR